MNGPDQPSSSDPEKVLSQALRAMAGGPTGNRATDHPSGAGSGDGSPTATPQFTTTQVLLIAAIVGVVIGMGIALVLLAVG